MTKNLKIKLLIYTVIFLTVLNIAAIGTIVWHIARMHQIQQSEQTYKKQTNEKIQAQKHLKRLFKTLDLTAAQQQQFMNEHLKFISKVKPLFHQLRQLHKNIALQLKQPEPNLDSIKYYSDKVGEIHAKLTYLEATEFLALEKICTPKQRKKLYQLYSSRFAKHNRHPRRAIRRKNFNR